MLDPLARFLSSEHLMPHGMCFMWRPELVWLHALSDGLIATAYYSIPVMLAFFVYRRQDLAFPWIFLLFGLFILACGTTHVMSIWTLWNPDYWVEGGIKVLTAAASLGTAAALWHIMPLALTLPSRAELEEVNDRLARQVEERHRAEQEVRAFSAELETRVRARTRELEAANARLETALREKQVLLQEVHHRVKNNLQVISGLLSMQARHGPPELASYFRDSLERIRVMGRVHDQLHRAEDASSFDLAGYLEQLCANLGEVYGIASARISCRLEVAPARVDLDLATPLVLIVNEVIANALKHAFPGGREGAITISLQRREDEVVLVVRDDGIGLPAERAQGGGSSMGLKLIEMLASQIAAKVEIVRECGTRMTLILPVSPGHSMLASA
jgi:two-component sensor histidine kinase